MLVLKATLSVGCDSPPPKPEVSWADPREPLDPPDFDDPPQAATVTARATRNTVSATRKATRAGRRARCATGDMDAPRRSLALARWADQRPKTGPLGQTNVSLLAIPADVKPGPTSRP